MVGQGGLRGSKTTRYGLPGLLIPHRFPHFLPYSFLHPIIEQNRSFPSSLPPVFPCGIELARPGTSENGACVGSDGCLHPPSAGFLPKTARDSAQNSELWAVGLSFNRTHPGSTEFMRCAPVHIGREAGIHARVHI